MIEEKIIYFQQFIRKSKCPYDNTPLTHKHTLIKNFVASLHRDFNLIVKLIKIHTQKIYSRCEWCYAKNAEITENGGQILTVCY